MSKKRMIFWLTALVVLLPVVGALLTPELTVPLRAAGIGGQILTGYSTYTNNVYEGRATEYTFSVDGIVQNSPNPPAVADWLTPSVFYDYGWSRFSWNPVFTYSSNGAIGQTSDSLAIPATATWVTISSFQVERTGVNNPIGNTSFRYSVDGITELTTDNELNIPPNALWATLYSFTDGWTNTTDHVHWSYELNRPVPHIASLTVSSDGAPGYAKTGDTITVELETDIAIQSPIIKIAGTTVAATGSGTSWSASLAVTDMLPEGAVSLSAAIFSEAGAPGSVFTATTNNSVVFYDKTAPQLTYSLSPSGPSNEDVSVQVSAADASSSIASFKWASGNQNVNYFVAQGHDLLGSNAGAALATDSFTVTENGTFTLYARDIAGNEAVFPITVSSIDKIPPVIVLTPSGTAGPTNTDVEIRLDASDNVAIAKRLWAAGLQNAAFFQSGNGTSLNDGFSVTQNGVYSVYVEDTAGNSALETIEVANIFKQVPELMLTPSPSGPTNGDVVVGIEASIAGESAGNNLAKLRAAKGDRNADYFIGGGEDVLSAAEFIADENGMYTVYARDAAGNETVKTVEIKSIFKQAPELMLTPSPSAPTNGDVVVGIEAAVADDSAGNGLAGLRAAKGDRNAAYFIGGGGEDVLDESAFTADESGMYTVYARDAAGNETVKTLEITNIFKQAPELMLTPSPSGPTNGNVEVGIAAIVAGESAGNGLAELRAAKGDQNAAYFIGGGGEDVLDESAFTADENGTYTVYARDAAGNETVEAIEITNIFKQAPELSLTFSPSAPTNANVVVGVEVSVAGTAADNSLAELGAAKGEQDAAYFIGGGGEDVLNEEEFVADENGTYTVYARDAAGNETVKTIEITNIFKQIPELTLTSSRNTPTNGNVEVGIAVTFAGESAGNGLAGLRAAKGDRNAAYFIGGGGEDVLDGSAFTADESGTYTVYARDAAGNETVKTVEITNIFKQAPELMLTPSPSAPTNGNVEVGIAATVAGESAGNGLAELRAAKGDQNAAYFIGGGGENMLDESAFTADENGMYTVYARDAAGNETMETIELTNILRQAPELTLTSSPSAPTNGDVVVSIDASVAGTAAGNSLAELRVAKGDFDTAYFIGGGGEDVLDESEFTADENGTYTIYARDAAGNKTVERITISNVDRMKPALTLTSDYTAPINGNVMISVTASDSESGVRTVLWSAVSPETENPWPSEEVMDGVFVATANGLYTVIAYDYAGNSTVQQINVMNIYRDEPKLQLSLETEEPTGERAAVLAQVTAVGDGNSIAVVKWAEGEEPIAFFSGGAGNDITEARQFDAQTNGVYTVYTKDAAGNEAAATIEVDNIRRINADLAALTLSIDGQPVTLSPVFDPRQTHYTAQVASEVASVLLTASAADMAASVAVNGKAVQAGEQAVVSLNYGANTVDVEATAQLASVKQTYEIEITRARPAAAALPIIRSQIFGLRLNGQPITGLTESSIVDSSGALHYELKLESAGAIVSAASAGGENVLRIESQSGVAHKAEQVRFAFSTEAIRQLKDLKLKLVLSIEETEYEMPLDFSKSNSNELSVQLAVPGGTKLAKRLLDQTNTALAHNWNVKQASAAVSFASGGITGKGSLLLPLPDALNAVEARKLAVYMKVENGESRLMAGKVRYDAGGKATGITIETEGSGQAIVLAAEPIVTSYDNYMNGYGDGRFAPDRAVTRAELAALLTKLSPAGQAGAAAGGDTDFGDVPQEHWAAEAIAKAAASSWMSGGPDGSFRPESPLTRAELAVVLARWLAAQGTEQPAMFADAAEHWAASAISIVSEQGWLTGYEDGSFRPDRQVTRAQAVAVLNRVLGRPQLSGSGGDWQDVPASHWAADAIRSATQSFREEAYLNGETEVVAIQKP
ncbi:hypothetical protein A7K91_22145 [Paenibacillus oryzae]|uniref:SLH domain-containing protein n=1 Tax=Paenibacillus oryzae TaxID=1844972 RepID=A0A1A5YPV5_9BACL|nr:S-layer homology domain-containing protein [Paenibacillus oryzae]OBR67588.1 hypothetical protein A7K91_22145 [Paenibacillus oryzae]